MNTSSPTATNPQDSANLDFLRTVAVLLVFCVHGLDIAQGGGEKWGLDWRLGQLGVLMFFVHTCLVLMWSLERSHLTGARLFGWFYVRRIFRLYPLAIVCVLFAYVVDPNWDPRNLWVNLTMTQYFTAGGQATIPPLFGPLWTLPLEMMMYVVLPFLFLFFREKERGWLFVVWAVALAGSFAQPALGSGFLVLKYAPCFMGGVIAWRLMRRSQPTRLPAWLWPAALVLVSLAWMTAKREEWLPLHIGLSGLLLGLAIPHFHEMTWGPLVKFSRVIARYSYSIYLTHFPIFIFLFNDSVHHPMFKVIHQVYVLKHGNRAVHWSSYVVLPVLVPFLTYHLVEKPGMGLGRKLAGWLERQGAPAPVKDVPADKQNPAAALR